MKSAVSLYEFMPYGAPELLESRQRDLGRALVLASASLLVFAAAAGGIGVWVGGETATPIEVWNLSSLPNMDRLALDTLGNAGFAVSFGTPDGTPYPATTVVDFTDGTDEVTRRQLANLLHVDGGAYVSRPDANSPVPYRLIIADDYNPCPRVDWMDPLIVGTATPAPTWTPTPTATETSTPEPAPPTETPTP